MCSPTAEQLKEASHHVMYELSMLAHSFHRLALTETRLRINAELTEYQKHELLKDGYVFLECFLLHARVLSEFLGKNKGKPDDVRAYHFFKDHQMPEELANENDIPLLKMIHKKLAHITTSRSKDSQQTWDKVDISNNLIKRLEIFCEKVDKNRLDDNWKEFDNVIRQFKEHLTNNSTNNLQFVPSTTGYNGTTVYR